MYAKGSRSAPQFHEIAKGIRSAPIGVSSDVWCGMLGWDAVTLSRAWQTGKVVTSEKVA